MLPTIRYALDVTGTNLDNLVENEVHSLSTKAIRAVAPKYGPIFKSGLIIYDHGTDRLLKLGQDYSLAELLQDASLHYGKEIYQIILITNPNVSDKVRINYQALGGYYENDASGMISLYETAMSDNRSVDWVNVENKPVSYPPTLHNHLLHDLYGFEPVIAALERVRNAMILGDIPAFESIIETLQKHINDMNNPHEVTAHQAGTYTKDEIDTLINSIRQAANNALDGLQAHLLDKANPHATTAAQVGTYSSGQIDDLINALKVTVSGLSNSMTNHTHSTLVNGTASVVLSTAGTLTSNGDVVAFSDERLKENCQTIEEALSKLFTLDGFTYKRTDLKDFESAGVSAQKLQKILPQLVRVQENGYLAVNYDGLAALFVEAIKESHIFSVQCYNDLAQRLEQQDELIKQLLAKLG